MMKKTKLSLLIIVGFLFTVPSLSFAVTSGLQVVFEKTPLFSEANFLPGEAISRWVKVTNNSGELQKIGVNVINFTPGCANSYCLADALDLTIKNGSSDLYHGTLSDFYNAGEIYLSDLSNGQTTQYDFSIVFLPESGNDYQSLSTSFDFEIGFFGGESVGPEVNPSGGGGGGGSSYHNLIILNEKYNGVNLQTANITWDTNIPATSRVIYDTTSHSTLGNPPNYGYAFSNSEDSTMVINHSMVIAGLTPGVRYYYRCVSHASPPTVSREHSFIAGAGTIHFYEESSSGEITPPGTGSGMALEGGQTRENNVGEGEESNTSGENNGNEEGISINENGSISNPSESKNPMLLASVFQFLSHLSLKDWIIILLILFMLFLFLLLLACKRKKEEEEERR